MHAAGRWRAFVPVSGDLCFIIAFYISLLLCSAVKLAWLQTSVQHAGADEMHDMGIAFKQHWPQGSTHDILSSISVHATAVSLSTGTMWCEPSWPQHCRQPTQDHQATCRAWVSITVCSEHKTNAKPVGTTQLCHSRYTEMKPLARLLFACCQWPAVAPEFPAQNLLHSSPTHA